MQIRFLLLFVIAAFFVCGLKSAVSADVVLPRVKSVWIETKQDFPDYDFYLGNIQVKSFYNQGRRYEMLYDTLKLEAISLTVKTPVPVFDFDNYQKNFLIAVKKSSGLKNSKELEARVKDLVKGGKSLKVLFKELDDYFYDDGDSSRRDTYKTFTLEKITETEMEISANFRAPVKGEAEKVSALDFSSKYLHIGLGLMVAGLIIGGGIVFSRRRKL